jgi:hypothetical protein
MLISSFLLKHFNQWVDRAGILQSACRNHLAGFVSQCPLQLK